MVTAGWIKLSFHSRVLLTVLLICWIMAGTFMVFQYQREREFKTELLNTKLQMYNAAIIDDMKRGEDIAMILHRIAPPADDLRVTLIDSIGNVVFDNNDKTPFPVANHNSRPEIVSARKKGVGYTVERHSESDDVDYFYSATLGPAGKVLRAAVPYTHSLNTFLRADRTLLWILMGMTAAMSMVAFFATRKISLTISRLNRFAEKAEKGQRIYDDEAFPNDELGSIAGHIVRLYVQRDRQHNEALRQQEDKIRLKKQLTNNINHELKTPVASMLVCLELLHDHPELPEEKKREFINRILANAQRLNSLLKDVSTITQLDEGAEMIETAPVNLAELIREVVDEERLRTSMSITTNVPDITIDGNRLLLESVFRNLIDNAIAHSGGTEIHITADTNGNFTVSDNGCGVPEIHIPHLFERFYRIDAGRSRAEGGTGLGLAIVRNALALHGSGITVSNNHGLTFRFRLGN